MECWRDVEKGRKEFRKKFYLKSVSDKAQICCLLKSDFVHPMYVF